MLPEWFSLLPPWLVVGLSVGAVASVAVAGIFWIGESLFPATPTAGATQVDGTTRRRREIRDYLRSIGEPFTEDPVVHGESVAFYLPGRDVVITFDAQAYFRLERTGTRAVLCEHEMPGAQLGRRLPFEVPDVEPDPVADPVSDAFDHLDLPTTADADEVTAAYRERVKEVHPDHGGDQESFKELRDAYSTAKDHVR